MAYRMKILMTSYELDSFSGAPLFARDLSKALRERGHDVALYSPFWGRLSANMLKDGFNIARSLKDLNFAPDIIHGNHMVSLLQALKRFPGVPGVHVQHGIGSPLTSVPINRIYRYVAVDDLCRRDLAGCPSVTPDRISVLLNFVDLDQFPGRSQLPSKPRRALIFSNYADASTHLPVIASACQTRGIPYDTVGAGVSRTVEAPAKILLNYDLVFAKARCAIEAMATGAAVILCDRQGLGGLVTTSNFDAFRQLNFGHATLAQPLDADKIVGEIARYDAEDIARVSTRIRREAGLAEAAERWLALYHDVLAEKKRAPNNEEQQVLATEIIKLKVVMGVGQLAGNLRTLPFIGAFPYNQLRSFWRPIRRRIMNTARHPLR